MAPKLCLAESVAETATHSAIHESPESRRGRHLLRRIGALPSVVVGKLLAVAEHNGGCAVVSYGEGPETIGTSARSTVELSCAQVGAQVVLAFEGGEPSRPIILGVLCSALAGAEERKASSVANKHAGRLVLDAAQQVVLRCGRSSITLTKAGKILIEGDYVVSSSTGVNRLRGGAVQIN